MQSMADIDIPSWPRFEEDEIAAVVRVLESGRVNQWTGPEVTEFESEWAAVSCCQHAFAMANGTVSLEAAIRALRLDASGEVIVPARTHVSSGMAVAIAGARPVFADVDSRTGCVTVESLEAARTPQTVVAIVVHIGGWVADIVAIQAWAKANGIVIVEDAAQAHGATRHDAMGNTRWAGTFGQFGSWSFCQDKIVSTGGEGGMLGVADPELADRVWSLRDHGRCRRKVESHIPSNQFAWSAESLGSNLRMTCLQAAIGKVQLTKLDGWIAARSRNAKILAERLSVIDWLELPVCEPDHHPAWYRVYAMVRSDAKHACSRRDGVLHAVSEIGLPIGVGSCPEIYRESALREWAPSDRCANAQSLGERCLCFPCHHLITPQAMQAFADRIVEACRLVDAKYI